MAKKGQIPWNKGLVGAQVAWNKGIPRTKEEKKKMSESHMGKKLTNEHKNNISEATKLAAKAGKMKIFEGGHTPWNKNGHHTEKSKQKMSESHKGLKLSKEHKKKIGKGNKGRMVSEETKQKISKANKGKKRSEETKKKLSKAFRGRKNSKETKRKMSKTAKLRIKNGEHKTFFKKGRVVPIEIRKKITKAQSGENHYNWKGGISCEPYCQLWMDKEFKESIKKRDNYICQNPYCWGRSKKLDIHHINYIKKNCQPNNLITLCASCNIRANFNREYWQELYSRILQNSIGDVVNG